MKVAFKEDKMLDTEGNEPSNQREKTGGGSPGNDSVKQTKPRMDKHKKMSHHQTVSEKQSLENESAQGEMVTWQSMKEHK